MLKEKTIYKVYKKANDLDYKLLVTSDGYYKIYDYAMTILKEDGEYLINIYQWNNDNEIMEERTIREIKIKGGNKYVWNIEDKNKDI